jgi:hypothetical protein
VSGWIGIDEFGVVERVDDESIATEFYTVIVPVWPRGSRYRTRSRGGEPQTVSIARHSASVALGLVRTTLWLLALVLAAPSLAVPARWIELLTLAVPLAVLAAILTFVTGRLPADECDRRRLLRRVVGIGAPPELLPRDLVARIRDALEHAWREVSALPWPQAITDGEANELLVVLAEYHDRRALAARARANLVHRRAARA